MEAGAQVGPRTGSRRPKGKAKNVCQKVPSAGDSGVKRTPSAVLDVLERQLYAENGSLSRPVLSLIAELKEAHLAAAKKDSRR